MAALAKEDEIKPVNEDSAPDIEQIKKRLDMLDRRLDNVDSVVSAVAERIMKQPITFNVTCSKCGQKIEIAIIGTEKPSR
jgi:phage I-like protein